MALGWEVEKSLNLQDSQKSKELWSQNEEETKSFEYSKSALFQPCEGRTKK